MLLTDPLGSALTSFSNLAGSAAVQANRAYSPYGNLQYKAGTFSTTKGFTGQYHNPATQLDYYGARYYDPKASMFLSADSVQGNLQGMNPYAYVGGNPETRNDPTGNYYSTEGGITQHGGANGYVMLGGNVFTTVINDDGGNFWTLGGQYHHIHGSLSVSTFSREQENTYESYDPNTDPNNTPLAKFQHVTGWTDLSQTWGDPHASVEDKAWALARFIGTNVNNVVQLGMIIGGPEGEEAAAVEEGVTTVVEEGATVVEEGAATAEGEVSGGLGKLTNGEYNVSEKGLDIVRNHLSQPDFLEEDGTMAPENTAMVGRLQAALNAGRTISGADASFYFHGGRNGVQRGSRGGYSQIWGFSL